MKKALILFVIIFLMTMLVPLISMTKSSSSSELVTSEISNLERRGMYFYRCFLSLSVTLVGHSNI